MMINTRPKEVASALQRTRPTDIIYEESIHTLTDSEYTAADLTQGTTKRRKLDLTSKPRQHYELRSETLQSTIFVEEEEYMVLRL